VALKDGRKKAQKAQKRGGFEFPAFELFVPLCG
jgi:hypothetical protein